MHLTDIHPNTRLLLEAWQNMQAAPGAPTPDCPSLGGHPSLVSGLLLLELMDDRAWLIRMAGPDVCRRVGRPLANRNFTDLWSGPDRMMVTAFLDAVRLDGDTGMIRAKGETLTGRCVELEITLIGLRTGNQASPRARILGLYQPRQLPDEWIEEPVFRHRISVLIPPDTRAPSRRPRLVVSR